MNILKDVKFGVIGGSVYFYMGLFFFEMKYKM